MPPRGGLLLLVATAVAAATLLVAVPLLRTPVASELAGVELTGHTAANGETLELALGAAFGKKQQALRQMAPTVRKEKTVISGKAIFARMALYGDFV